MTDPFDSADYYTCDADAESFWCKTPDEALSERLECTYAADTPATLTVYGHATRMLDPGERTQLADVIESALVEFMTDDPRGNPEDDDCAVPDRVRAAIGKLVGEVTETMRPWACVPSGARDFNAIEARKRLWPEEFATP